MTRMSHPSAPVPPARRTYRPLVEALEDRTLPTAGALDPSFGTGGIVTRTALGPLSGEIDAGAFQPDGKIVLAGLTSTTANDLPRNVFVLRYDANGALDASFGNGGRVETELGSGK